MSKGTLRTCERFVPTAPSSANILAAGPAATALDDASVKERFAKLGSTAPKPEDRGPDGLQRLVEREMAYITPILKAAAPAN